MKTLITFLVLFFFPLHAFSQTEERISGKIISENNEGMLHLTAISTNESPTYQELNYILVSVKKGKSGNSSNKQGGKFSLAPGETKTLSESKINLAKKDALKVFLFLRNEETGKTIAKDSLQINAEEFQSQISYIPEENLELSGLTIDETRTRMGQYFYEAFFRKYMQLPTKYSGAITITELPSIGRNSMITITKEDQPVYSFQVKPDEEKLEEEANRTLSYIQEAERKKKMLSSEFKY